MLITHQECGQTDCEQRKREVFVWMYACERLCALPMSLTWSRPIVAYHSLVTLPVLVSLSRAHVYLHTHPRTQGERVTLNEK